MFKPSVKRNFPKNRADAVVASFLTIAEVARLLGVSSEMVRVHERRGHLGAIKLATGERLFLRPEVKRFLTEWRAKAHKAKRGRAGRKDKGS